MSRASAATSYDTEKRAAWAGRARAYADTFAALCAHGVEPLVDALGVTSQDDVLDVGTGPGTAALAAAARGGRVVGVDVDSEMLDLARERGSAVQWREAGLPRLPWPGPSFDVVIGNFVINHVGDPRAAAAELRRVTRPGGRVGLTVWPRPSSPLHRLWDDVVDDSGVTRPAAALPLPPGLDFTRTPEGLAGLLAGCGWAVTDARNVPFVHVVAPDAWWSAAELGVATIGATYLAQADDGRAAMRASYERLRSRFVGDDGLLHLPSSFVLATATTR